MSKDIRNQIIDECCKIWNSLDKKVNIVNVLIEWRTKIADLEERLALTEKAFELACKYGAFDTDILLREAQEELKNG